MISRRARLVASSALVFVADPNDRLLHAQLNG
jgi:hypothetical protein